MILETLIATFGALFKFAKRIVMFIRFRIQNSSTRGGFISQVLFIRSLLAPIPRALSKLSEIVMIYEHHKYKIRYRNSSVTIISTTRKLPPKKNPMGVTENQYVQHSKSTNKSDKCHIRIWNNLYCSIYECITFKCDS